MSDYVETFMTVRLYEEETKEKQTTSLKGQVDIKDNHDNTKKT